MKTFMPVYLASRSEGELEDEDQKRIQLNRKSIEVVGHENSVLSPLLNMPKKAKASLKMVYAPMAFLMTRPSSMYHRFPKRLFSLWSMDNGTASMGGGEEEMHAPTMRQLLR